MFRRSKKNISSGSIVAALAIFSLVAGCDRLAVEDTLTEDYTLTNQFGEQVSLPDDYSGKVLVVGYVYTNCPDICPMITYNMRDLQREFPGEEDFHLISISFDPERDTPEVLHSYAESYSIDQTNWSMLTGEKGEVNEVLDKLGIATVKTPSRFTDDNKEVYFIDHTDKVSLIDKKGQVRNHYLGSELDTETVIEDIKTLLTE
jgi:protein SCO1/2